MVATERPAVVFLDIRESADNALAISAARKLARELGFTETEEFLIATAVSELATNILRYAGTGQVTLRSLKNGQGRGVEVVAMDSGPGIENLENAMRDHFSTGGSLGLGLPSVKRIMDQFVVEARPGGGTICTARKWLDTPCS
ncbi:anti-sigma regulatory factor [Fundidesulfovibrio butyratiphilus]